MKHLIIRAFFSFVTATSLLVFGASPARATFPTANPYPSAHAVAPIVTLSGAPNLVSISLGNTTAKPSPTQVQFTGWCWDANYRRIDFSNHPTVIVVPPDPNTVKGGTVLARVSQLLKTPKACVHHSNLRAMGIPDGFYAVKLAVPGSAPWAAMSAVFYIGKPFVLANIRYNLDLKTGHTPANSQAHHTLPQAYRATFTAAGFNIDDPQHLVWWCSRRGVPTNHQSHSGKYNALWKKWLANHPVPSTATAKAKWRDEALKFRDSIFGRFTYNCP